MKLYFTLLLLILSTGLLAQKVKGLVTDSSGNILPYASISIKGTTKGTTTNSQGQFSISVSPGNYTLVCQYVNFKKEEKFIKVENTDVQVNFVLSIQQLTLSEVIVKKGEDPAYEIIRKAIKKRSYYNEQVDSFTVDVYIKGLVRSRGMPQKFMGKKIEHEKEGRDSLGRGILFLSESVTKVAYAKPGKLKYEVISSRVSGESGGFGLTFPFFINFYQNNVTLFERLNPRGFVSPIADAALTYYRFRYEGSFFEDNKMINTIRVIPRRKSEPLFSGIIQITEDDWRIYSLELLTTKDFSLELADSLRISQIHGPVTTDVWKTNNQVLYVTSKFMGFEFAGNFVNVYSDYNIQPGFGKKYFDRIVMKYDTAFNKKDSIYWSQVRPVTLEQDEKRDFVVKDSMAKVYRDSFVTRTNIDSLRKNQKPIKLGNILFSGGRYHFFGKNLTVNYYFKALVPLIQYNTVEGWVIVADQTLNFSMRKAKHNALLDIISRFGLSNEHFNVYGNLTLRKKNADFIRNTYLRLSGGKRVSQFNHQSPVEPFANSVTTLFYKRNYMKIYENWFGHGEYYTRFDNGLKLNIHATFEERLPLQNTTDFTFFYKNRTITPNHPFELAHIPFSNHQAFVAGITLSYQPGQKYIQFPKYKVPIGSKYPTFTLEYNKGFPGIFSSDVNFDKWKFSVHDNLNLKLRGEFRYKFSLGGFINSKKVEIPDYQHFNGNQVFNIHQYVDAFQLAPYYKYSNTENFYVVAHAEHHFNGLLTNKIPLFNKLKWHLVAGSNAFYVNNDNHYFEVFAGLENIFKIFRVDLITAYQPGANYKFAVKVGAGGIIGGTIRVNR